jgi:hypothetical protein
MRSSQWLRGKTLVECNVYEQADCTTTQITDGDFIERHTR